MCLEICMACINQQRLLKFHFSIFPFIWFRLRRYVKQPTNCSLLGTDQYLGRQFQVSFNSTVILLMAKITQNAMTVLI